MLERFLNRQQVPDFCKEAEIKRKVTEALLDLYPTREEALLIGLNTYNGTLSMDSSLQLVNNEIGVPTQIPVEIVIQASIPEIVEILSKGVGLTLDEVVKFFFMADILNPARALARSRPDGDIFYAPTYSVRYFDESRRFVTRMFQVKPVTYFQMLRRYCNDKCREDVDRPVSLMNNYPDSVFIGAYTSSPQREDTPLARIDASWKNDFVTARWDKLRKVKGKIMYTCFELCFAGDKERSLGTQEILRCIINVKSENVELATRDEKTNKRLVFMFDFEGNLIESNKR